ncbi:MAG TPA: response regulator transcription factor [Candidatus Binataceae bacterium]|nr:response regulator transcription factor [Candidatus Binataceae bacterium]
MPSPTRLIIADDHTVFRQGLKSLLLLQPDVEVVREIASAGELDAALAETPCDILLLDLQLDRSVLGDIKSISSRTTVVILTASENFEDAVTALRYGARAIVQKRFAVETLMEAIRTAAEGLVWTPPALQAELAAQLSAPITKRLTAREAEVVRYVAVGLRNAEVAQKLSISESTVKTHLNNIFQKLEMRDRVELTRYALRVGLASTNEDTP